VPLQNTTHSEMMKVDKVWLLASYLAHQKNIGPNINIRLDPNSMYCFVNTLRLMMDNQVWSQGISTAHL